MKIDLIYINESIRIRKEYLNNLAFIVKREDEIQSFSDAIVSINEEITTSETLSEKYVEEKLGDIDKNVNELRTYLVRYYDNIQKLDEEQRTLYNNIKDYYPDITDDEMQTQIMVYIDVVNDEFFRNNKELYKKLADK